MKIRALFSSLGQSFQARRNKPGGRTDTRKVTPVEVPPVHKPASLPFSQKTLDRWQVTPVEGRPLISFQGKKLKSDQLTEFKQELISHYKEEYNDDLLLEYKIDFLLVKMGLAQGHPGKVKPTGWFSASKLAPHHLKTLDTYLSLPEPISCGKQMLNDDLQLGQAFIFYFLLLTSRETGNPSIHNLIASGLVVEVDDGENEGEDDDDVLNAFPAKILVTMSHLDELEKAEAADKADEEKSEQKQKAVDTSPFLKLCPAIVSPENLIQVCLELEQEIPEEARCELLTFMASPTPETARELAQLPSINELDGLAESLSTIARCHQSSVELQHQLKLATTSKKPVTKEQFLDLIHTLSESSTSPELTRLFSALESDLNKNQLSSERYQNYLLVLSILMPEQTSLLGSITRCLDPQWLNQKPEKTLQQSSWSQSFHQDINAIRIKTNQEMEGIPGHISKIDSYLAQLSDPNDSGNTYDIALNRLYNSTNSALKVIRNFKTTTAITTWLEKALPSAQSTLAEQCIERLPQSLSYLTGRAIDPKQLAVEQTMKAEWSKGLSKIKLKPAGESEASQPFSGRATLNQDGVNHKTKRATEALSKYSLGRFMNNTKSGATMSRFLKTSLTDYAQQIEHHRLREVTPIELSADLKSAETDIKYKVTEQPDGNYKVQQTYTTKRPLYRFGADDKGKVQLQEYRVTAETVVDRKKLKIGEIHAPPPQISVSVISGKAGVKLSQQDMEPEIEKWPPLRQPFRPLMSARKSSS
ncbi:hypothetical protein EOPP23_15475 [Endozoicomonas sp. OPT23]|uniref:hypothetical protein n=1 Tax=Endozoicomonas sp. OPT23 TaxID=2072845 RepID=UPI001DE5F53B|nr:hypothetical protein [Endozoicomonas sp. OPT23]MRI34389.1 hypothetical protein [Endozoicomonas sp. OPT23]